jgi:diketogulonate reductase-like aldo/keto reductase
MIQLTRLLLSFDYVLPNIPHASLPLWRRYHGFDTAMIQFTKSLVSFGVERIDLFLLHYPICWPELCGADFQAKGTWHDSWRALEALVDKGLIRAIGEYINQSSQ